MRRTKIICTLGPACSDDATLRAMLRAGMDVARLNFSHGTHDEHRAMSARVRQLAEEMCRTLAIMMDLQGPKIRTGRLAAGPVELVPGATFTITTDDVPGDAQCVSTTYDRLPQDVNAGDRILLADGAMELRAVSKTETSVVCEVVYGGLLDEHKGINLPGVAVSAPPLTDKDRRDLALATELGADWIALSFVRSANDIRVIRAALTQLGCDARVVAKLEKPEGIGELDEILSLADAVMVARGDLGVELSPEQVPVLQKRIIAAANRQAIPVITATQMLESMIQNPRPTRAEASDVANAIFDGTDAIMLSGEASIGRYPVEAVTMMDRIAREAEKSLLAARPFIDAPPRPGNDYPDALARAACQVAVDLNASGIVAMTRSGYTARLVSAYRPSVPIIAVTPSLATCERAGLYWGVYPYLCAEFSAGDDMVAAVNEAAVTVAGVAPGSTVVVISGAQVLDSSTTHALRLQRISGR
ncbi:MAG TPA: pyruvate kinase [Armatimonadota bacterium]|nr:pyruvate kinase [Armatimonadota bacterium]